MSESDHENNSAMPAHWAWKFRLIKAAIASSLSAAVMPPWLRRFLAITFFTGTAAGAAALLLIAFGGAFAWAAALPLAAFGAAALAADAFPLPAEAFFLVCVLVAAFDDGPPLAAWGASSLTGALPSVKGLRADFFCRGIGICSSAPERVMLGAPPSFAARPVRAACRGRVLACWGSKHTDEKPTCDGGGKRVASEEPSIPNSK